METTNQSFELKSRKARLADFPAASPKLDWAIALLSFYFLCGLFLDGWAHNHGQVDDTFFTPWHAVLYSGFGLLALTLAGTQLVNVQKGHRWTRALPKGYGLALLGAGLFGAGGGFDFLWHSLFGFEANVEALLSPAHLLLAGGGFLMVTAPLRAAWLQKSPLTEHPLPASLPAAIEHSLPASLPIAMGRDRGWGQLPALISMTCALMALQFFSQYSHYLNNPESLIQYPGRSAFYDVYLIHAMLLPSALLMGWLMLYMRRWKLPVGALTALLTVQTALMFWLRFEFVSPYPLLLLAPVLAGILGDALLWRLKPSVERSLALRIFAFAVPFVLALLYYVIAITQYGIWWRIHMWLGVSVMAGIVGLFLSYLTVPPQAEASAA